MSQQKTPVFYRPAFGNDNGYAQHDNVDIAAFVAPMVKRRDAALDAAALPEIKAV